jgi:enamine deaminase RidA (YjgF/YER057c/UK114 family)
LAITTLLGLLCPAFARRAPRWLETHSGRRVGPCPARAVELYGEAGAHARSAVGLAELPFGIPVEIEAEVRIRE